jgi:hypothetical protein
MDQFLIQFVTHPEAVLAIFFTLASAAAFVVFLWGFTGYILAHEHEEHQKHASSQIVWGGSLLIQLFILWEVVRWLAGLFSGEGNVIPTDLAVILVAIEIGLVIAWYFVLQKK